MNGQKISVEEKLQGMSNVDIREVKQMILP